MFSYDDDEDVELVVVEENIRGQPPRLTRRGGPRRRTTLVVPFFFADIIDARGPRVVTSARAVLERTEVDESMVGTADGGRQGSKKLLDEEK